MTDFDAIDTAILNRISKGDKPTFNSIWTAVRELADALAPEPKPGRGRGREGWRVVDRRLQALRKKGRLHYSRQTGWEVA